MIKLYVETEDRGGLEDLIVRTNRRMENTQPILKIIGQYMLGSIDRNFEMQGRPSRWTPLAPSTIAGRRNKNKKSIKILQDTGLLRGSITYKADKNTLAVGTNVHYAPYHQFGAKIPAMTIVPRRAKALRFMIGDKVVYATKVKQKAKIIPARPFLLFQEEDKEIIGDIFLDNILKN